MDRTSARIFRLIETADNFVKYAKPGGEARAAERARKRYQRAYELASVSGDDAMLEQARIRIHDLEARAIEVPEPGALSDEMGEAGATATGVVEGGRVPPGQRVTRGWPVLHEGRVPRFDPATWRLEIDGACERTIALTYDELRALPNVAIHADMHCVTGWSKLDMDWNGVSLRTLLELASPSADAGHVLVHAEKGYTANLPLVSVLDDDVLVAWGQGGVDLAPKHGFPLRLVVPKLYAWKSVKWVRRIELLPSDRRGYWEVRGYHNRADPWLEERYSYQEET